jgi:hypothetical protein
MKLRSGLFLFGILLTCSIGAFAQGGGKAEPNEIKFAPGKSSATLSATLSGDQQREYSFTAKAGQTVYLKCGPQFDFRLFQQDADFDTEWNSGSDNFELPADGEYILFVRKKRSPVKSARFNLTITIK